MLENNSHLETVVFSGDLAKRDKNGYIYYVGRKDSLMKIKGYRVNPSEIEEILAEIDQVSEVIVGSVTNSDLQEEIYCCITLHSTVEDGEILRICRERMAHYMVPTRVCITDRLPITSNGKIDRQLIQQEVESYGNE